MIENMEQLRLQLSPLPLFCSSRHPYTCAFLGAQITGMADPVRLSRHVSHGDGLRTLYDLATSVRLFREGQRLFPQDLRRNRQQVIIEVLLPTKL